MCLEYADCVKSCDASFADIQVGRVGETNMGFEKPSDNDLASSATKFDQTIFYLFPAMLVVVPLAIVLLDIKNRISVQSSSFVNLALPTHVHCVPAAEVYPKFQVILFCRVASDG